MQMVETFLYSKLTTSMSRRVRQNPNRKMKWRKCGQTISLPILPILDISNKSLESMFKPAKELCFDLASTCSNCFRPAVIPQESRFTLARTRLWMDQLLLLL
ncbi:unnamed protein product [Nippostrongylus brasiliensis]|uniref:Ovule protein n=1 Tax=Nippostrongylus brasiliensis TaxID=27835 RepID=A0A158R257_NIPBR|nr:unnamed protein product [Nippostrongylus brasiliensis]